MSDQTTDGGRHGGQVPRAAVVKTELKEEALGLAGVGLLLGIGVLAYMRANKKEGWIRNAGAALGESEAELEPAEGYP